MNPDYTLLNKNELVPYNLIIEQTIIAEILLNKQSLSTIFYKVKTDFFHSQNYQYIFKASKELYEEQREINVDTLSDRLKLSGHLKIIGGVEGLIQLLNTIVGTNDIETYIVLLIDKYIRRQIVYGAIKIQQLAYQQFDSIERLFEEAEKILFSITQEKQSTNLLLTSEVLLETFIDLEKRSLENKYSGIKTGFFDLDELTQGFQKSDLIIIAGRPSMGKTAFALNLVRNVSELQPSPVIVFSLEMSRQQLIYRILSKESQVMHSKLRTGDINKKEWYSISKAINILASLKIYLDDTPNLSLNSMRNKINNLQTIHGHIGMIVLDYLQLLNDPRNKDSRVQELSRLTRGLKILAKEFDTPILVLSQLSRNVESRVNKRPLLSDLRESGCVVGNILLYVPCKNNYLKIKSIINNKNNYSVLSSIKEQEQQNISCQIATLKRAYYTGIKFIYKLETFNKNVLKITSGHKIFTLKGWVKVNKLETIDLVCLLDLENFSKVLYSKTNLNKNRYNPGFSFVGLTKINFFGSSECYDLWVPFTNNYTANNVVIHNSIEQDADLVLMLYRDSYYDNNLKSEENNLIEVIITKHRNGPIGTINIIFEPRTLTFDNFIF